MDYIGLLNMCKLPGMSSFEVVSRIRRLLGMKRVGHTGTLDPSAAGVLPICLGRATRLAEYVAAGPKHYRAEFLFGVATESSDAEGQVVAVTDASHLTEAAVAAVLPRFTGTFMQYPPLHSAVQVGGVRAYNLVRQGKDVELRAREVTVFSLTPVRFVAGEHPRLLADMAVSKGTYIRSLARDLGEALGVGATLSFLARTQVGDCRMEDAVTLEELAEAQQAGEFARWLRTPDSALTYIPALHLPPAAERYQWGTEAKVAAEEGLYRIYFAERFLGLGRVTQGIVRAVVNLVAPDELAK